MFSSWFDTPGSSSSTEVVPAASQAAAHAGVPPGKAMPKANMYDIQATLPSSGAAAHSQDIIPDQELPAAAAAAVFAVTADQQQQPQQQGSDTASERPTAITINREITDADYFAIIKHLNGVPREISVQNPYAPKDPLHYANPNWRYKPVDPTKFIGYWQKCPVRSTPPPFPIHMKMDMSKMASMLVETVPGMLFQLTPDKKVLEMRSIMDFVPAFLVALGADYCEPYPLDGSKGSWYQRRDLVVGKHYGQIFMTTDDVLILRVYAVGLISKTPDWVAEDYLTIQPDGKTMLVRLTCRDPKKPSRESWQYIVGEYKGPNRPAKASK